MTSHKKTEKVFLKSLSIITSSKTLLTFCLFLNIFFLFSILYIFNKFYPKIIDELIIISNLIGTGALTVQSNQALFYESYNNVIKYFFLMTLSLYFSYSVLQGIAWKIAIKRIMKKLTLITYLRRFFAINAVWLLLILLIFAAYVQLTFANAAILSNRFPSIILNMLFTMLLAALFYFIMLSYTLAYKHGFIKNLKKVFKLGINSFKKTYKPVLALYFVFIFNFFIMDFFKNEFTIIGIIILISILFIEILRWEFTIRTLH